MANFSGSFSTNSSAETRVCDGLVELILNYEVIRDLANNTYQYKASLYLNASRCKYFSTARSTLLPSATISRLSIYKKASYADYGYEEDIEFDACINKGADPIHGGGEGSYEVPNFGLFDFDTSQTVHLKSVESEIIQVSEDSEEITFEAYTQPGEMWKAYEKNLLSYVESPTQIKWRSPMTFRGIAPRNTITGVSGSSLLGQTHTIKVSKGEPEYTHTIECICWRGTGENREEIVAPVCTKSSSESISFIPPDSFASLNTYGTELNATFKMTTYYGDIVKGEHTFDYTFKVPDTIAPSCTLEVTDGEGLSSLYGGYVQGHSRFHIKVNPTLAFDSPIKEYEVEVDGAVYVLKKPEMDTALIKESGAHSIRARVTDQRGHTGEYASITIEALPYKGPVISELAAIRCDLDGTENSKGDHFKVIFSAEVTPLSNKNTAAYVVTHSKTTGLDYVEEVLDDYTGMYAVTDGVYMFPADLDSTYVIQVKVVDSFEEHIRVTGGGLTTILMNWLASGHGMCFGGVATLEDTVECQFKFYPSGGLIIPPYPYDDLFVKEPNVYYVEKPTDVAGSPTTDPYVIEIYPTKPDGSEVVQRLTTCPKKGGAPKVIVRAVRESEWGSFYDVTTGQTL